MTGATRGRRIGEIRCALDGRSYPPCTLRGGATPPSLSPSSACHAIERGQEKETKIMPRPLTSRSKHEKGVFYWDQPFLVVCCCFFLVVLGKGSFLVGLVDQIFQLALNLVEMVKTKNG